MGDTILGEDRHETGTRRSTILVSVKKTLVGRAHPR